MKRPRQDESFVATFEQINAIRQLVDIVSCVLGRVCFRLRKRSDGSLQLSIDTVDPHHVCIVQCRLCCKGEIFEQEEVQFCLDTKTLVTCLRNINNHHSVDFVGHRGSADVILRSYDILDSVEASVFTLNTFEQESDELPLDNIQFDFYSEVCLPELKKIIKLGTDLKVNTIVFNVLTLSDGTTAVDVSGVGDASFRRRLPTTDTEASAASPSPANEQVLYKAAFTLEYLSKFIKAMDHNMLTMKLGDTKPLFIDYPLGVTESFVRFVLAPKIDA